MCNLFRPVISIIFLPSSDALQLHVLRATYQGGHFGECTYRPPCYPRSIRLGMVKDLQPLATTLDLHACDIEKAAAAGQLWLCKECKKPCKCCMAGVTCTTLCTCRAFAMEAACSIRLHMILGQLLLNYNHGPLSKRRGSEKKAYLGEMKAWLGSIVDICTSMCAYNMCYSGKLS